MTSNILLTIAAVLLAINIILNGYGVYVMFFKKNDPQPKNKLLNDELTRKPATNPTNHPLAIMQRIVTNIEFTRKYEILIIRHRDAGGTWGRMLQIYDLTTDKVIFFTPIEGAQVVSALKKADKFMRGVTNNYGFDK